MDQQSRSDEILVKRILSGDQASEETLYKRYVEMVYHTIKRMTGDREDSIELTQQSFIKVFRFLKNHDPNKSLAGWIQRIAVNTTLSHLKKKKTKVLSLEDGIQIPIGTEPKSRDHLLQTAIHRAIQNLPQGSRIVFTLFAIEGLSHEEIGRQLEISESTSKTQYRRARLLLQEMLQPILNYGY